MIGVGIALAVFVGLAPALVLAEEKRTDNAPLTIEIRANPPKVIAGASRPPLRGVSLVLGSGTGLGQPFVGDAQALGGCVERPNLKARLCVDLLDWPPALLNLMRPPTDDAYSGTYSGAEAIIRYDNDTVTRVNVLFPAPAFHAVIEHLESRYGPPTEQQRVTRSPPGQSEITNTIVRWKSLTAETAAATILEVRALDDLRHAHTDPRHGLVLLYRQGASPSFTQFNTVDLMVLRQRRLGQWGPEHELDR